MRLYFVVWPHGANGDPRDIARSMKLYLGAQTKAGSTLADFRAVRGAGPSFRFLLSYFYFRDSNLDDLIEMFEGCELDIFVDSGAYSAATTGGAIEAKAYIEWVQKWQHIITAASAPDVIGDPVATARDTSLMQSAGLKVPVLPVFHVGEPWEILKEIAEHSEYFALGGMVPYARRQNFLRAWTAKAFSFIPQGRKVHAFGMTGWELMKEFPWYSVDSSSWTGAVRFGQFQLFDQGLMVDVDMRDRAGLLKKGDLLRRYGLSGRKSLSGGAAYDRDSVMVANLLSWQAAERWLTERRSNPPNSQSSRPSRR